MQKKATEEKPPHISTRKALLKLEVSSATDSQLGQVAKNLYEIDYQPREAAEDSQVWQKTDEELYNIAKQKYDGLINPFLEKPRVFRFESTREKVWESLLTKEEIYRIEADKRVKERERQEEEKRLQRKKDDEYIKERERQRQLEEEYVKSGKPIPGARRSIKSSRNNAGASNRLSLITELQRESLFAAGSEELKEPADYTSTYLDPFGIPLPWREEILHGKRTYYNPVTRQRLFEKPYEQVWNEKLVKLEQLEPRADLDGYEYKESAAEKRRRNRLQKEFEEKLRTEIDRRINAPNELEQVEDALFFVVDTVCKQEEALLAQERKRARKLDKVRWHVATRGFNMKPLAERRIITDKVMGEGETDQMVCNLDFRNVLISDTGEVLPFTIPEGLLEMFHR